jgi:hypothetical protein
MVWWLCTQPLQDVAISQDPTYSYYIRVFDHGVYQGNRKDHPEFGGGLETVAIDSQL